MIIEKDRDISLIEKLAEKSPELKELLRTDPLLTISFCKTGEECIVVTSKSMVETVKAKYFKKGYVLKEDFERLEPYIVKVESLRERVYEDRKNLKDVIEEIETAKKDLAFVRKEPAFSKILASREKLYGERIARASEIPSLQKYLAESKEALRKAVLELKEAKR